VALHALCGNLNLERVLPPQFRDLWRDLDAKVEIRKKEMVSKILEAADKEVAKKKEAEDKLSTVSLMFDDGTLLTFWLRHKQNGSISTHTTNCIYE